MTTTFEVYPDAGGAYRWRSRHDNGQVTAGSQESFDSQSNAERAVADFLDEIRRPVSIQTVIDDDAPAKPKPKRKRRA